MIREAELREHIENLDSQVKPINECLICHINRTELISMMKEKPEDGLETENHAVARLLIFNCRSCFDWYNSLQMKAHNG